MKEDVLPPLRDVIEAHDLKAKKGLGQNFLLDLNITRKIARLAGARAGVSFVEVGPGPGGLTRALLMEGVDQLQVIERDERVKPILQQISDHYPGCLSVTIGDAREFDWQNSSDGAYEVVANLPYNIGTDLLTGWLSLERPLPFSRLCLMFQDEVARRIVAKPGSKTYGRLSVLANWLCETEILHRLPPEAFTPAPKVTSAVVSLIPRKSLLYQPKVNTVAEVTAAAFGQRRKMLRSSLKSLGPHMVEVLETLSIDPMSRAETLTGDDFCRIAIAIEARDEG